MTPPAFFETFVRGNRDDCEANRGCARRAFNAAVAASHLADHYFQFSRMHDPALVAAYTTLGEFVEHLVKETNGAFRDIRSISNAYKHLYEDPRMAVYSSISSTGAIQVIEFDDESELKEISEDDFRDAVVFTRKDGTTSEFFPTLEKVMEYWDRHI